MYAILYNISIDILFLLRITVNYSLSQPGCLDNFILHFPHFFRQMTDKKPAAYSLFELAQILIKNIDPITLSTGYFTQYPQSYEILNQLIRCQCGYVQSTNNISAGQGWFCIQEIQQTPGIGNLPIQYPYGFTFQALFHQQDTLQG